MIDNNNNKMGYKYWVAFEIRCVQTDNRLFQNHTIFFNKEIVDENDLTLITDTFKSKFESHAHYNNKPSSFKITLTSWPHLLGLAEAPLTEQVQKTIQPSIRLVVDNTKLDEAVTQ